jgi:hypothetical protein
VTIESRNGEVRVERRLAQFPEQDCAGDADRGGSRAHRDPHPPKRRRREDGDRPDWSNLAPRTSPSRHAARQRASLGQAVAAGRGNRPGLPRRASWRGDQRPHLKGANAPMSVRGRSRQMATGELATVNTNIDYWPGS